MTAPRFFLESIEPDELLVIGDDAVHAVRALRLRADEIIDICDGRGNVASCSVISVERNMLCRVLSRVFVPQPTPRLTVFQGVPKTGKMDDVVRMLTQAGVHAIAAVAMHRSVSRWDAKKAASQQARHTAIAREAAMQSRRAWLPQILPLTRIEDLPGSILICTEDASERLSIALPADPPEELALLIGPEGGIDQAEIDLLVEKGARVASLGPNVFRTELAGLVAAVIAAARYELLG